MEKGKNELKFKMFLIVKMSSLSLLYLGSYSYETLIGKWTVRHLLFLSVAIGQPALCGRWSTRWTLGASYCQQAMTKRLQMVMEW